MGDTGYFECELVAVIVKRYWIAWEWECSFGRFVDLGIGLGGFFMFWGEERYIWHLYSVDKHCVVYGINKIDVEK